MKGICPICEKETELEVINRNENIVVRGEEISVPVEYFKCSECGSEFNDPKSVHDPLELAYRIYRNHHSMMQPESIRQFREQYGVTQLELSNLLGLGGATLSRYENGALQDEAHDTMLRLVMEPQNFLELIEEKPIVFSERKRERILQLLKEITGEYEKSLLAIYEARFGSYPIDINSGYQSLNISKLFNEIIFFCKGDRVPKTKLNKLLFYADFKHFKEYTISITGVQYAHLPYGPAPDHYQLYLATLLDEENAVSVEEQPFNGYSGEYLSSIKEPDLSVFSTTEIKVLALVKEYFNPLNASEISELSHKERGYQVTKDGQLISYEYAQYLSI